MITNPRAPIALMTCESGRPFAEEVAKHMQMDLIPTNETWFACGEGKMEIKSNVRGHDVYIFQSPVGGVDDLSVYDRFIMLLHAIEAAALSAGLFARMLQSAGANRVVSVEIHNDAIAGMFNPSLAHLENVFLTRHLVEWLQKEKITCDVVVSPDVGYLERARAYAEELSADLAALSKERDYSKPNQVFRSTLIGDVSGQNVLLVDDIVDSGGSVVAAISELKERGAKDIVVACTHPIMSGPAWARMSELKERSIKEGWKFDFVGTSTVQHTDTPDWYHVFHIEKLLATIIQKINSRGSVTQVQQDRE